MLAPAVAVLGGVVAGPAAAFQEFFHGSLLVAFAGAPIIEDALKPLGLYALLAWRPASLGGRLRTGFLSGIAGLTFGLVESTLYVWVYHAEHTQAFVVYRYTATVALHALWSFILGFGINRRLLASIWGEAPFLSGNWAFFVVPMALHSLYNMGATVYPVVSG